MRFFIQNKVKVVFKILILVKFINQKIETILIY